MLQLYHYKYVPYSIFKYTYDIDTVIQCPFCIVQLYLPTFVYTRLLYILVKRSKHASSTDRDVNTVIGESTGKCVYLRTIAANKYSFSFALES